MTTGKKIFIALAVVLVGAAVVGANIYYRRDRERNEKREYYQKDELFHCLNEIFERVVIA